MSKENSSDGEDDALDLFNEPEGYYEPEKAPTTISHRMQDGRELRLRLVGHNPLWGHLLWQAGITISKYLETHASELLENRTVLELGAGAGLPSLIAALHNARGVVVTDYPDAELIENLRHNISTNVPESADFGNGRHPNIAAEGYLWGGDIEHLTAHLLEQPGSGQRTQQSREKEEQQQQEEKKFDLLILADLLFNHSEHTKLLSTIRLTLKRSAESQALVFFTPYRPWLLEKDLAFFELARESGDFVVEKIFEHEMDKVMFEEDRGDEKLRRTVFGYCLKWKPERLDGR